MQCRFLFLNLEIASRVAPSLKKSAIIFAEHQTAQIAVMSFQKEAY